MEIVMSTNAELVKQVMSAVEQYRKREINNEQFLSVCFTLGARANTVPDEEPIEAVEKRLVTSGRKRGRK